MSARPNPIIPTFHVGDRFRKAREEIGLDQGPFAALIGISRGSVSNYERGATHPRPIVLNAWANATGVSREWLEHGIGEPQPPDGGEELERLTASKQARTHGNTVTRAYPQAA